MRRRPRLTVSVNVKLTPDDFLNLEAISDTEGVTPTEMARRAVKKLLDGPDPQLLALTESIVTLRYVVLNGLPWLAPVHLDPATKPREALILEDLLRRLLAEADQRTPEKARALLKAVAR